MKIFILFITLYFSQTLLSHSEIKSCKSYKKNSDEYKFCVEDNLKFRNAKIKKWKLSDLFERDQDKTVKNLGNNIFWVQGYDKKDVLTAGTAHCSKVGGSFLKVEMISHYPTQVTRAILTFKCQV